MRVLLDTHAFLWFALDSPELSPTAAAVIEDPNNQTYMSIVSVWEMAIKVSTGKLILNRPFSQLKVELVDANGFEIQQVEFAHAVLVSSLPFHHKDPFDRLLAAQSLVEQMPLISRDEVFDAYGVSRIW